MPTTFLSSSLFTGGGNIKTLKEEPPLRKERKRCLRKGKDDMTDRSSESLRKVSITSDSRSGMACLYRGSRVTEKKRSAEREDSACHCRSDSRGQLFSFISFSPLSGA